VYVIKDLAGASHTIALIETVYFILKTVIPFLEIKIKSLTKSVRNSLASLGFDVP